MEFGPPALFVMRLSMNWPRATKNTIGSSHVSRKDKNGDICSTISLENSAPESFRR